jgi:hypothetical protein
MDLGKAGWSDSPSWRKRTAQLLELIPVGSKVGLHFLLYETASLMRQADS